MTDELAIECLRHFDAWTMGEPDFSWAGHRTHYSHRYRSLLLSWPSTDLQPLDVVLFYPLQEAYGKAVHDHTHNARRGVTKRLFLAVL